jgi:hypothetical protein
VDDDEITSDPDDRAIARALGAEVDDEESGMIDSRALDEYRVTLSHLPFDEVSPPPDLETRVVEAALARRPSSTTALQRTGDRRRTVIRWGALGAVAAAAAVVVGVLLTTNTPTTHPSASIQTVAVTRDDVDAVLAKPDTRTGTLAGEGIRGEVALASNGEGYVYDTAVTVPAGKVTWLWLDTGEGFVGVGPVTDPAQGVEFDVEGPVDDVRGVALSFETAAATPGTPSSAPAVAELRTR